jgi:hypothetical protein
MGAHALVLLVLTLACCWCWCWCVGARRGWLACFRRKPAHSLSLHIAYLHREHVTSEHCTSSLDWSVWFLSIACVGGESQPLPRATRDMLHYKSQKAQYQCQA